MRTLQGIDLELGEVGGRVVEPGPDRENDQELDDREKEPEGALVPEDDETPASKDVEEALKKVPKPVREMFMAAQYSGPIAHPIFKRFTSENVTHFLELCDSDSSRDFNTQKRSQWMRFSAFLAFLAVLIFLIIFLIDKDKDLLANILIGLMLAIGGIGGGYGLAKGG